MTDKLHQINIAYVDKEDRLLMRTTTQHGEEYRIWLTRRFTGLLFNILHKVMNNHGGATAIGSEQQTKQMFKSGAFEKEFEDDKSTSFPIGKDGFLAFGLKTGNTPEGNLHLEILPEKGAGVTFNLNKQLLYALYNLLSQGISRAEWQISGKEDADSQPIH